MKLYAFCIMSACLLLLNACQDYESVSSYGDETKISFSSDLESFDAETNTLSKANPGGNITVMTRNIYIGTDVANVLNAMDPTQIPVLAAQALQEIVNTNFPERAVSLAREVLLTRPHVIGLQEVQLLRIQQVSDAVFGGTVPAMDEFLNYLDILMAALESFGLHYEVAAVIENVDVEMPFISGFIPPSTYTFSDIRVTDRDVLLVRSDVAYSNVTATTYQYNLPIASLGIDLKRGYVGADVEVGHKSYRVLNTHLEPYYQPIQLAQAAELLGSVAGEDLPVILLGDFNSPAPVGETYDFILDYNFTDTWIENSFKHNPDGFTYGHAEDLLNAEADFYERIDHIYVRNGASNGKGTLLRNVLAIVIGDEQFNRTESGLWPSDHGGVVAKLLFSSGPAVAQQ